MKVNLNTILNNIIVLIGIICVLWLAGSFIDVQIGHETGVYHAWNLFLQMSESFKANV